MKVLIVVDMQNDFITGSLGTEEAQKILPKVIEKVKNFDGDAIHLTLDSHDGQLYPYTQEGNLLPVEHCVRGTWGWNLPQELFDALDAKDTWSCSFTKETFGSADLGNYLFYRSKGNAPISEVVLVGLCTDICVVSNALLIKAFLPETKITVDAACCAGTTPENHESALRTMQACQVNIENWTTQKEGDNG